jgi:hypothetical protein
MLPFGDDMPVFLILISNTTNILNSQNIQSAEIICQYRGNCANNGVELLDPHNEKSVHSYLIICSLQNIHLMLKPLSVEIL